MNQKKLYFYSIVVALAGFLFGFDTVVVSGADQPLASMWGNYRLFGTADAFHGIVVMSSALWGTVIGALFGAWPTNRFGRKNTLVFIGLFFLVSAIGSAVFSDPYLFAAFRFLGGLGVGASTIAAPAYIAEISPSAQRGRLVALYQSNLVFGILMAFLSNYLINDLIAQDSWRFMLAAEAIPALIYSLMVFRVPQSPRWLVSKGRVQKALEILESLFDKKEAEEQLKAIQNNLDHSTGESVFQRKYSRQLWLVIALAAFNQFSGINAFLYYSPRIFEMAGLGESAALLSSIGVGVVNLAFTLVGMSLIDRSGRKRLMLIGSLGYIVSLGLVTYSFATEWFGLHIPFFFFLFIASHAIGQGAVIWVFISEIFPNKQRAQGQAVGTSTHWILAALIPALVPLLFSSIGAPVMFGIFTFMMLLQLVWVLFVMPETKGVSLETLSASLSE